MVLSNTSGIGGGGGGGGSGGGGDGGDGGDGGGGNDRAEYGYDLLSDHEYMSEGRDVGLSGTLSSDEDEDEDEVEEVGDGGEGTMVPKSKTRKTGPKLGTKWKSKKATGSAGGGVYGHNAERGDALGRLAHTFKETCAKQQLKLLNGLMNGSNGRNVNGLKGNKTDVAHAGDSFAGGTGGSYGAYDPLMVAGYYRLLSGVLTGDGSCLEQSVDGAAGSGEAAAGSAISMRTYTR